MSRTSGPFQPAALTARYVAQGVLCALAGSCVLGGMVAWWRGAPQRPARSLASSVVEAPAAPAEFKLPTLPAAPLAPSSLPASSSLPLAPSALPSLPPAPLPMPLPAPSRTAAVAPGPTLPPGMEIRDPQVLEALTAAREVRRLGDTQAALESLRSADLRAPRHPEILAEIALTYEAMGLTNKAETYWRQLFTMGEEGAGGYFALASSKISAPDAKSSALPEPSSSVPVALGRCQVLRDPQTNRVTLRVPIGATPGATIDPAQLDIHVSLFDTDSSGEMPKQVPESNVSPSWVSAPVNWKDSAEEWVDVAYSPTRSTPSASPRTFYGFTVKLFYQNKLAGEQAQPEAMRATELSPAGPAGLDNSLFPK
ncbi:MAG: tetratricopeptide repeat protein [Roseimicrobium sp.]